MSGDDFDHAYDVVAETRRRWSLAEKRRIVEEASVACTNVSAVARRHGIKPALLYRWKKELGGADVDAPALVPVAVTAVSVNEDADEPDSATYMIEIELSNGRTIRVPQQIDAGVLARLIKALER